MFQFFLPFIVWTIYGLVVWFAIAITYRVRARARRHASLVRLLSHYQSAPVRRCMRFAASKGYDPYNSHTVQARCFKLQAGSRS